MAKAAHKPRESPHEHRMIEITRGVTKARLQILGLEIRHFRQELLGCQTGSEQIEDITDANAHPAHARPAAALLRIDGDALSDLIHEASIPTATTPQIMRACPDEASLTP